MFFYWRGFGRPRHPFMRVLIGALGLVLLAGVLALGILALAAFAVIGTLVLIVRAFAGSGALPATASREPDAIEGEFVVLPDPAASPKR